MARVSKGRGGMKRNSSGWLLALAGLISASPAVAAVVTAGPHAFELRQEVVVAAPPQAVWARLGRVKTWWNPAHTYGGRADALTLQLTPGGCFCERLAGGGGVEHLRVTHVEPGRALTLAGALGPLASEAVAGVLQITLAPDGAGTRLTATYRASGFARANAATFAPAVDRVLAEQWSRLAAANAGPPR